MRYFLYYLTSMNGFIYLPLTVCFQPGYNSVYKDSTLTLEEFPRGHYIKWRTIYTAYLLPKFSNSWRITE